MCKIESFWKSWYLFFGHENLALPVVIDAFTTGKYLCWIDRFLIMSGITYLLFIVFDFTV